MTVKVELEEDLIEAAMRKSGASSEREGVEAALRYFVDRQAPGALAALWGKVEWEGNLEQTRLGHVDEWLEGEK